ncbi:replication initiator protein [Capybara microvirus Cap1_SP_158]|nr:replication initiator protein [Capybara microvirus Cap1_SP_158]
MSCNKPNRIFILAELNPDTGNNLTRFCGHQIEQLWYTDPEDRKTFIYSSEKVDTRIFYPTYSSYYYDVPCGQCSACRSDYSYSWMVRLMLERYYHSPTECWFITLTYDDEHLPTCLPYANEETGENIETQWHSLERDAIPRFNKRLKAKLSYDKFKSDFKFYACGEYGIRGTRRPHYHAIYFGLPINDLKYYKQVGKVTLYTSDYINKVWKKGFCVIEPMTAVNAQYTAGYIAKKMKGKDGTEFYAKLQIEPPFSLCSKGLGKQYLLDNTDKILRHDCVIFSDAEKGAVKAPIPRYFKKLLAREYPTEMLYRNLFDEQAFYEYIEGLKEQIPNYYSYLDSVEESAIKKSHQRRCQL